MGWIVPYEEGAGAVVARGTIGPFGTREEAERQAGCMVERYPYWVPTGDPTEIDRDSFDADPESKPCRACGQWYEDCACERFNGKAN